MSPPEVEIDGVHYDTIDINIIPDSYVTWIVDIWRGQKNDPATAVARYIGVWNGEDLEDDQGFAIDPDFSGMGQRSYGYDEHRIKPRPLHWALLEEIKKADRDAEQYKSQQNGLLSDGYSYGTESTRKALYKKFMEAIEILGPDPDNEEAWEAIHAWREYGANRHEK